MNRSIVVIILTCSLLCAQQSQMLMISQHISAASSSPAFVQGCHNAQNFSTTAISCTLGSSTPSGNVLAVGMMWGPTFTLTSITDSGCSTGSSNSYTLAPASPVLGASLTVNQMAYAVVSQTGTCTITALISSSSSQSTIIVHEISGVNNTTPVDNGSSGSNMTVNSIPGTGANGCSSGNITTTKANDYLFGYVSNTSGNGNTYTAGTAPVTFTNRITENTFGSKSAQSEDGIAATSGTYSSAFTSSGNSSCTTGVIAFQTP